MDECWREIVGNVEEIKRRLEVKHIVLKNLTGGYHKKKID